MAKREATLVVRLRDRATGVLKKFNRGLNNTVKVAGLAGVAIAGIAAATGARFLAGAIRNSGEFGEQMSILQGLTQATREEMEALEASAREAGASTRFSATEAAQGLEELSRGGQSVTESIQTLNPVLNLAAGNNQTVAESAQQVVTALNQFGLAADQSSRVADVLTRAAQKSAQTVGELNEALIPSAPIAKQAGLSIEQTAGIIGRLADQGFRGSLGGTALRNALIDLQDPSSNFRRELEKLGIRSTNFVEVLAELERRGGDADAALRALGKRSGPAITALVSSGSTELQQLIEQLDAAGGASADAAKAMEDNLPGAFRNLKSAFSELQIALTQDLTGEIKDGVFDLAEVVRNFAASDTLTTLRDLLVDTFQAGRKAVTEFIGGIDFADVREKVRDFVDRAREKISEFQQGASELGSAFTRIVGATNVLVGGLRASFNLLGVVIGGVVTAAAFGLEKLFGLFNKVTFGMDGFISSTHQALADARASFAQTTGEFANALGDSAGQIARGWDQIAEAGRQGARGTVDGIDEELDRGGESAEAYRERLVQALEEAGVNARSSMDEAAEGADNLSESTEQASAAAEQHASTLADLERQADESKSSFDRLKESISEASNTSELEGLVRQMGALAQQGEINEEQFASLRDAALDKADGLEAAAEANKKHKASADKSAQSTKAQADAAGEASGEINKVGKSSRQAGFEIQWMSEAAELFRQRLGEFEGMGNFRWRAHFKRAMEEAIALEKELAYEKELLAREEAKLQRLREAGVPTIEDAAQQNRELRFELMRLRGEEEKLAELKDREERKEIDRQITKALQEGEMELVQALRERLNLLDEIQREEERQADRESDPTRKADEERRRAEEAERAADAAEREQQARGGAAPSRDIGINLHISTSAAEAGAPALAQADLQNLANQLLPILLERIRAEFGKGI